MAGSGRRRLEDGGRGTQRGGRHVVVVESPAKARTIGAWLGSPYRVMATRGHVRDLPARAGSVDPGDGFSMVYETGKAAARTLGAIAKALARADILVLATDPDQEGEAIAWQVLTWWKHLSHRRRRAFQDREWAGPRTRRACAAARQLVAARWRARFF